MNIRLIFFLPNLIGCTEQHPGVRASPLLNIALFQQTTLMRLFYLSMGFPGGSDSKASVYSVEDPDSIPGLGRSGEGNGNSLQYSCLENPMDRGAWQATIHGVSKSRIRLCDFTFVRHILCDLLVYSLTSLSSP